ncbi:MAG: nuclear transport factor 2 family protein [Thermoleophilia bacterium]
MSAIREQVIGTTRAYYDAFMRCDLPGTMAFWADRDDVSCIAPLFDPAHGREAVEALYRDVLAIVSAEVFAYDVLHVSIEDPLAVVTCQERSTNIEHGHTNELLSTNVLILDCGGWRVLHRHVSWRATREILAGQT